MPYLGEPFDATYFEGDGSRPDGYPEYGVWAERHAFAVAWADDIETHTGLVTGKDILDVGCAYGFLTAELEARGATVVGIDLSSYCIAEANSRFPALTFVEDDFITNPFSNNQFDLTVGLGVLECMDTDPLMQTFLNQVNRVTKPTGIYYFLIDFDNNPPFYYQNKSTAEWLLAMEAGLPGPYDFDVENVGHLPLYYATRVVVT